MSAAATSCWRAGNRRYMVAMPIPARAASSRLGPDIPHCGCVRAHATGPADPQLRVYLLGAGRSERGHRSAELGGAASGRAGASEFEDHGVLLGLAEGVEGLSCPWARCQGGGEIGWHGGVALRRVGGCPPAVGLRGIDLRQASRSHSPGGDLLL